MTRRLCLLTVCGFAAILTGCSGGVEVEGKVTRGGGPLDLKEGEVMKVLLTSEDGKTTGTGEVGTDGSFKVKTADGATIPPGKYKVSYMIYPPKPADERKGQPPPVMRDAKEVWEVTSTNRSFTLDLPGSPAKK